jgi:hypothetical protein
VGALSVVALLLPCSAGEVGGDGVDDRLGEVAGPANVVSVDVARGEVPVVGERPVPTDGVGDLVWSSPGSLAPHTDADFTGARYDDGTVWPEGFSPPSARSR